MKEMCLAAALAAACIFAFRYLTLVRALGAAERELKEIQRDLSQNRFLHLPLPNPALERLIGTINAGLEEIRRERREYARREREFQQQIENISHDLRTPLTVILGYLQLMKEKDGRAGAVRQGEEQAALLAVIERNARTMERLTGQFYLYSQLNAQDYKLELQPLDAGRLLRETVAANYQALAQAKLEVVCDLPEHPVGVWGDAQALERIFTNLLQNAGRYAASELHIRIEEEPEAVRISFANDTAQLLEEDMPHLFERFYVQNSARGQGGSGLGLTVARGLAEAMGGGLTAELVRTGEEGNEGEPVVRGRRVLCFWLWLKRG